MNLFAAAWYWKRFYWKVFSTFDVAVSTAIIAGMATADPGVFGTIFAQKLIFWLAVQVAGVKAVDALIDQTFNQLSQNGHGTSGNGTPPPAPVTPAKTT